MRTENLNKPADHPREYLEFALTTAEKKQLKQWAVEEDMPMGQYIRFRLFGVRPQKK